MEDFTTHFVGYLLAGLVPYGVAFVVSLSLVVVLYGMVGLGAVPGIMAEDETLLIGGAAIGAIAGSLTMFLAMTAVVSPLHVSLLRSMHEHHRSGADLDIRASMRHARRLGPRAFGVMLATGTLTGTGALFCLFPGVLASLFLVFALPAVALSELSPMAALGRSASHVRGNIQWHLGIWGLVVVVAIGGQGVPLIGPLLAVPFTYAFLARAYSAAFPNG